MAEKSKILLIEDDPGFARDLMKELRRGDRYEITHMVSVPESLLDMHDIVKALGEKDVILCDDTIWGPEGNIVMYLRHIPFWVNLNKVKALLVGISWCAEKRHELSAAGCDCNRDKNDIDSITRAVDIYRRTPSEFVKRRP